MIIVIAVAVAVFMGLFVSLLGMAVALQPRRSRGEKGERMVAARLRDLNPSVYKVFHDLYLPHPDGTGTTQIDHVVASRLGIFVIETKYLNGWIFGSGRQKKWTQSIYGRNTQFQNPLHQNHLHVLALQKFLGFPERCFHSLAFFVEGDFRTEMPENVISSDICGWIASRRHVLVGEMEFEIAVGKLEHLERVTDRKEAHALHVKELKARHRKGARAATPVPVLEPAPASTPVLPPPLPASPWTGAKPPALPQQFEQGSHAPVLDHALS